MRVRYDARCGGATHVASASYRFGAEEGDSEAGVGIPPAGAVLNPLRTARTISSRLMWHETYNVSGNRLDRLTRPGGTVYGTWGSVQFGPAPDLLPLGQFAGRSDQSDSGPNHRWVDEKQGWVRERQ